MLNALSREEQKISGLPSSRKSMTNSKQSVNSSDRRNSTDPLGISGDCDNLKQESDRKVVQGFFVNGIKQYYQDKLDRRVSLNQEASKVVYVVEIMPEIVLSDGEAQMYSRIENATLKASDMDLKDIVHKFIKLNDWSFTVKMESILTNNEDHTKILLNIKKFQLLDDFTLTCKRNVRLQKLVYESDVIKNLIKYTKHKI